jgi:hypothetical protein
VTLVVAAAGCGVRPTGAIDAGEAPTAEATALPESKVYFIKDRVLVPVTRSVSPLDDQAVFDALVAGPTAAERARGLSTGLTEVKGIQVMPDADGKMIGSFGTKVIMVRIYPSPSSRQLKAVGIVGITSKYAIEQLVCTGQALADHPSAVEVLPTDPEAATPNMIPMNCGQAPEPIPSAG